MPNVVASKRRDLGLTQGDMAELLGVSRQHYNAVENFKRQPSVALAKEASNILEVEWTIFFANLVNV